MDKDMDMQHGQGHAAATWKYNMDMDMKHGQGHGDGQAQWMPEWHACSMQLNT
jgi:hypothetical protein